MFGCLRVSSCVSVIACRCGNLVCDCLFVDCLEARLCGSLLACAFDVVARLLVCLLCCSVGHVDMCDHLRRNRLRVRLFDCVLDC